VSACGVIHNFIRTFDPNDELDPLEDEANALQAQDGGDQFSGGTGDILVQRPTGLQRRGRPLPKPCGLDTRQSFKGGCDGILKVDIVDIGQKTN